MGGKISSNVDSFRDPLTTPHADRPYTFDPLYGFPKGRKPREMKATWEEMEKAKLPVGLRDYCAHMAIPYIKCQRDNAPFAMHRCTGVFHDYWQCRFESDMIQRKEYEREKRLLKRKARKEKLAREQAQA
ncbi:hypothetical protein ACQ4LE_008960 [Meloidogyne hapla]|uniref:NADH dehydrogenase [ubiquinone] 1 beta subcomplex subunit 7 n=1 Tax=Meloidogyne hapla TaxID=6305 RepID=A0A1I8BRF8_MELHA